MATQDFRTERNHDREFVAKAMGIPLLSEEEEIDLAVRWRDQHDEKALHRMVSAYMRLVISTASKFRNYGLPLGDLVQEGNVGLMLAAARFDPTREVRFSTYASWWIRSAMQEFVLRNWSIVRTGTSAAQKSLFFNLRWLRAKIEGRPGELSVEEAKAELARQLNVNVDQVSAMDERLSRRDQSLNQPVGESGGEEWGSFIADDADGPETQAIRNRDNEIQSRWLKAALAELSDREQLIINRRRLQEDRSTLEELGGQLGITKERVRQIEHKAFEKLRSSVLRISRQAVDGGPMAYVN
ncbi:RNA polymerase factor sigma-32 [Oceanibacterium hippocampi]|uniref:RNA polymerase sigma factor n=1 Tax=Oceanibacterium hippocampi TaxID=745714 RepID=A0A1Y5SFQ6_9PROT|nr:RNA polymerase factor sigma-32 [Oceanibacterium hippocampi]SLN39654.1 RNA polymerase sigma factor RpoH [Oceanibacterium hippocampi]